MRYRRLQCIKAIVEGKQGVAARQGTFHFVILLDNPDRLNTRQALGSRHKIGILDQIGT